jgi:protease I
MALQNHIKVAVLVADGFEQVELTEPVKALRRAGVTTHVVSSEGDWVRGWRERDWESTVVPVDCELDLVDPADYHALILPGGPFNPDRLRMDTTAVAFVRHFGDHVKPIAAICRGTGVLIEGDMIRGRRVTSYPSLRTDLNNAGGEWSDEEVVVDGNLITGRDPEALPALVRVLKEKLLGDGESHL